jgi:hypothetical protein
VETVPQEHKTKCFHGLMIYFRVPTTLCPTALVIYGNRSSCGYIFLAMPLLQLPIIPFHSPYGILSKNELIWNIAGCLSCLGFLFVYAALPT